MIEANHGSKASKFRSTTKVKPWVGNQFAITGRINCALTLAGRKIN